MKNLLARDPEADPPDKYKVLEDAFDWVTNMGFPGYANAAIDEVFSTWLLNAMFAKAASGALTPEAALDEADKAVRRIFEKWRHKGLV